MMGGESFSNAAVSTAVALVTASRDGVQVSQATLLGDVPPTEVIAALSAMCIGLLLAMPSDAAENVLRSIGELAARRS